MPIHFNDPTPIQRTDLKCPHCGNTKTFQVDYLSTTSQEFIQDPDGERNYRDPVDDVDDIVEYQYTCRQCDTVLDDRAVTVTASSWQIQDDDHHSEPL